MKKPYPELLSAGKLGDFEVPNRMCMAPMTRFRVSTEGVPEAANVLYYSQRASAAIIVTESLYVEPRGLQETLTAGLYSAAQVSAWARVTRGVHDNGGRIFAQLAHAGRLSHPSLQPGNELPIAPSPIAEGVMVRLPHPETGDIQFVNTEVPRPLETDEVRAMVKEYARAAGRAMSAGFDGVEIHAGSGHLHRQFLQLSSNQRTDEYGGSARNRCRFVIETVEEIVARIGSGRVGIKIAPNFAYNGMTGDITEIEETYPLLCQALERFDLAYVHVQNPSWNLFFGPEDYDPVSHVRRHYRNTLLAGGEYDRHTGEAALGGGLCDFVVFGRRFLANPDLPARFELDAQENAWDDATVYLPGPTGFTDYPTLAELNAEV